MSDVFDPARAGKALQYICYYLKVPMTTLSKALGKPVAGILHGQVNDKRAYDEVARTLDLEDSRQAVRINENYIQPIVLAHKNDFVAIMRHLHGRNAHVLGVQKAWHSLHTCRKEQRAPSDELILSILAALNVPTICHIIVWQNLADRYALPKGWEQPPEKEARLIITHKPRRGPAPATKPGGTVAAEKEADAPAVSQHRTYSPVKVNQLDIHEAMRALGLIASFQQRKFDELARAMQSHLAHFTADHLRELINLELTYKEPVIMHLSGLLTGSTDCKGAMRIAQRIRDTVLRDAQDFDTVLKSYRNVNAQAVAQMEAKLPQLRCPNNKSLETLRKLRAMGFKTMYAFITAANLQGRYAEPASYITPEDTRVPMQDFVISPVHLTPAQRAALVRPEPTPKATQSAKR